MAQEEEKKEKEKLSRETMGKFFYDLAKASFTTMVIGAMMTFFTDPVIIWKTVFLLVIGLALTVFLAFLGAKILKH